MIGALYNDTIGGKPKAMKAPVLAVFTLLLISIGLRILTAQSDRVVAQELEIKPGRKTTSKPATSTPPRKPVENKTPRRVPPEMKLAPKIDMVLVPGGDFLMGSPEDEPGHYSDESPQHRVTVQSFYIGKYEVTQAQWRVVMDGNPSSFKGDDLPVENVSWDDAKEFCRRLSQMTGKEYRLPTEAEWEYACRAKTTGAYAGNLDAIAWYKENSHFQTHPVGQKLPNEFGLYDMHGNVWELCEDVYHHSYDGAPMDGSAWLSGEYSSFRVLRGGSYSNSARFCRSACRGSNGARIFNFDVGFRVVVSARTS